MALTFDDGPSAATPRILRVLNHFDAHATFFQIGREVGGHGALEREIVSNGNSIGNHSFTHPMLPAFDQLQHTSALIQSTGGYRPCLFRPPYGAVNGGLVGEARALHMSTIVWNVDPQDWSTPGTGAIESRVLGATRPGAIVIMHDGGGPRGQTVAALPHILGVLRHRGYRMVTVDRLLGYRPLYTP